MRFLTYYADPMCSWCWGFAPQIDLVAEHFKKRLPVLLVMGGLRPGTTEPMDQKLKSSIRNHWEHVAEQSGQPFDFSFFDRDGFIYDTEPACRAVVTVRAIAADRTLRFFRSIQKAFYADGKDVTKADTLAQLASEAGVDKDAFLAKFDSPEIHTSTVNDFLAGPRLGITGYPTLLAEDPDGPPQLVTAGYRKLDELIPALENWLMKSEGARSPTDAGAFPAHR